MRNSKSTVELSIPLLLKVLEFAKDGATSDEELRKVANNMIELSKYAGELGMIDYEAIMGGEEQLAERKLMMVRAGILK
tara:strand:+ start:21 stop:257 length:237 start_codon:yes stop_codon:yes gene_type:complete